MNNVTDQMLEVLYKLIEGDNKGKSEQYKQGVRDSINALEELETN